MSGYKYLDVIEHVLACCIACDICPPLDAFPFPPKGRARPAGITELELNVTTKQGFRALAEEGHTVEVLCKADLNAMD